MAGRKGFRVVDPGFNVAEWEKGIKFDIMHKGVCLGTIRPQRAKAAKVTPEIKPSNRLLTDEDGRSLWGHRARVDLYATHYDCGRDPLTLTPISEIESLEYYHEREDGTLAHLKTPKPVDEMTPSRRPYEYPEYRENRHAGNHDNDGIKLLAAAFKAMHEAG